MPIGQTVLITDRSANVHAAQVRLERLIGFLASDPENQLLLTDAFETALLAGDWQSAWTLLKRGQACTSEPLVWALKEGDYWMAQRRYDEARRVLNGLAATEDTPAGFRDTVLHNRAYIEFSVGAFGVCIDLLAPRMRPDVQALADVTSIGAPSADTAAPVRLTRATEASLQCLWLRALHHQAELDPACDWAGRVESLGRLDVRAAGIASLVAVDAERLDKARRWSRLALDHRTDADRPIEALVTQSSLALAARDPVLARRLADQALGFNPSEGRAWSVRGFSDLLIGDTAAAQKELEVALQHAPSHIGTWHGLGWARLLDKNLAGAEECFDRALALDRNFAESHGGLAVVQTLSGHLDSAQGSVERALRLDPNCLSGRYAQSLIRGGSRDASTMHRLALRLLSGRKGPFGEQISDWLPAEMAAPGQPED